MTVQAAPRDILDFWFNAGWDKWWEEDDAFDAEIRRRFGDANKAASEGRLDSWATAPEGALALVILLDQFSRNLFRDDHRAWMNDAKALKLARDAIGRGFDLAFSPGQRRWFYMPFMHAEDADAQRACIEYFSTRGDGPESLRFAEMHFDVIRRFGRFPHRNAILGRKTTPQEQTFLESGGFAG